MALSLLVIDDDNDLLDAIKMVLELDGFRITTAHNGTEALSLLDRRIKIDAILLDLTMPVMNGIEFLEIIDQKKIKIPIIVITAAGKPMLDSPIMKNVHHVLKKPFPVDDLLDLLQELSIEAHTPQKSKTDRKYLSGFHDPYI